MSVLLAVEPDATQAERLRQLVREHVDADLVVVTSAYAAIVAMNRQVPGLLLFGRSVAPRHQGMVLKHLRSLTEGAAPQALTIPALTPGHGAPQKTSRFRFGWSRQPSVDTDPRLFAEQISAAITVASRPTPAPVRFPSLVSEYRDEAHEVAPAGEDPLVLDEVPLVSAYAGVEDSAITEGYGTAPVAEPAPPSQVETPASDIESLIEQLGVGPVAIEVDETVEAAPTPEPVLIADEDDASDEVLIDIDRSWSGDGRVDADVHAAEIALVQAQAETRLASELERVRAEAAAQREVELARMEHEADELRLSAVAQARAAAEYEAQEALAVELARMRGHGEERLATELARVRAETEDALAAQVDRTREEAEQAKLAQLARVQADADALRTAAMEEARAQAARAAAEALDAEVARARTEAEARLARELARVRAESEATLSEELARTRAEADQARQAQLALVQAEADSLKVAAREEARLAAEGAAARELEAEVARVRSESEARLQAELARVRDEAEGTLSVHMEHARAEAEASREAQLAHAHRVRPDDPLDIVEVR
jgi:hypothetical protein